MRTWIFGSIVILSAMPAWGQTTQPADLPADKMLQDLLKPENAAPTSATTRPTVPEVLPGSSSKSSSDHTIREGTEIVNRAGYLRKSTEGPGQEFAFEDDASLASLPRMRILPDLKLMSMENASTATGRDLRFVVSGTVTEYKGHNYILLESSPEDSSRRAIAAAIATPVSTKPVSADQMLKDMLAGTNTASTTPASPRPTQQGPMTDKTSGSGAVAPGAPVLTVMREQSQIIDRIGRLTTSADGQLSEFTFDADGQTMQDPPLIILQNLKLDTMENAVHQTRKDIEFRVTGMITEYRGRNYILLEKVVVVPDATEQF